MRPIKGVNLVNYPIEDISFEEIKADLRCLMDDRSSLMPSISDSFAGAPRSDSTNMSFKNAFWATIYIILHNINNHCLKRKKSVWIWFMTFCRRRFRWFDPTTTQWTQDVIITSLLRRNDVATLFRRDNGVIITFCVRWITFFFVVCFCTNRGQSRTWIYTVAPIRPKVAMRSTHTVNGTAHNFTVERTNTWEANISNVI